MLVYGIFFSEGGTTYTKLDGAIAVDLPANFEGTSTPPANSCLAAPVRHQIPVGGSEGRVPEGLSDGGQVALSFRVADPLMLVTSILWLGPVGGLCPTYNFHMDMIKD